jgi:hypothetical protein
VHRSPRVAVYRSWLTCSPLHRAPRRGRHGYGRLNLWRGWGVSPEPGDWSLMRQQASSAAAFTLTCRCSNPHSALAEQTASDFRRVPSASPSRGGRKGSGQNPRFWKGGAEPARCVEDDRPDHGAGEFTEMTIRCDQRAEFAAQKSPGARCRIIHGMASTQPRVPHLLHLGRAATQQLGGRQLIPR